MNMEGGLVLRNKAVKFHLWMERNLQDSFLKAEMERARPMEKRNGASTGVCFITAVGLVAMVCWIAATAVR